MPSRMRPSLPFLALAAALLAPAARAEEPPPVCHRDGTGLRIEYRVEDQIKERTYREQGAPLDVRGIETRVLVLHGGSSWQRETGRDWAMDWDRVRQLYDEMQKEADAAGTITPRFLALKEQVAQAKASVKPIDRIAVEVPPPGWSFSYDNAEKYGTKHVRSEDLSAPDARGLAASGVFADLLAGRAPPSEVEPAGRKTFAGHDCALTKALRPARFEYCTTEIAGREVDLYRRLESPEGLAVTETAVAIDLDSCIAEGLFELPEGVELIDR